MRVIGSLFCTKLQKMQEKRVRGYHSGKKKGYVLKIPHPSAEQTDRYIDYSWEI